MYLQWTRKDVATAAVLCTLGVIGVVWTFSSKLPPDYLVPLITLASLSLAAIGAGIGALFHKIILGAILGGALLPSWLYVPGAVLVLTCGVPSVIGAAIGAPFRRKVVGALIANVVTLSLFLIIHARH